MTLATQVRGGWFWLSSLVAVLAAISPAGVASAQEPPGLAKAAHDVLKNYCYSCHGVRLAVPGFNVLDRDYLLKPTGEEKQPLVKPGDVAGSRIWQRVAVEKDMPPAEVQHRPTDFDLGILRQWIEAGAPLPKSGGRAHITEETVLRTIRNDLASQPTGNRKFQRYFTLTNLHNNPGLTDDDLALARAALVKLINSTSRSSELIWPKLIDAPAGRQYEGVIFRLDLRDVNWDLAAWQQAIKGYPYGIVYSDVNLRDVNDDLKTLWGEINADGIPYVRADWFVFNASRGDTYHALLNLPDTADALEKQLGVDRVKDFDEERVRRAGFVGSGISRHNRLVDRHRAQNTRYYYRSYDFKSSSGKSVLYTHPLGPEREGHPFPDVAFKEDGGEIIWSLANGLQGYLIVTNEGKRITEAPVDIVRDLSEISGSPTVVNGVSCIGCHRDGLHSYHDSIRKWSAAAGGAAQQKVERLFVEREEIDRLLASDSRVFRDANERLISPYLQLAAGQTLSSLPEPVTAMVRCYIRDLTRAEAAYEMGYSDPNALPLEGNQRLRELGLLPLAAGGKIPRDMWDSRQDSPASLFQRAATALGLGSGFNP